MKRGVLLELLAWNAECRRALFIWRDLRNTVLDRVIAEMPCNELDHLEHSVFRINAFMYLYARLRRQRHDTRLGVLCGILTYLLDYVYDKCSPTDERIDYLERLVNLEANPSGQGPTELAILQLVSLCWASLPDPEVVRCALAQMLCTQRDTMLQTSEQTPLTDDELRSLTKAKGHRSVCLYFSIANPHFSTNEAEHLAAFGYYMQYMDDLEDFYEDRSEHRGSCVPSVMAGCAEADGLLALAEPELAAFYDREAYDYDFFRTTARQYHRVILYACRRRELIRQLPQVFQRVVRARRAVLCRLLPLIYLSPMERY